MNKLKSYLGLTADTIAIFTFALSIFRFPNVGELIWIGGLGGPLSSSRFFATSIIVFFSSYAIGSFFSRFIINLDKYNKQFRVLIYGILSSVSAWITVFTFQSLLYGEDLYKGFFYKLGFAILVGLSGRLTYYFMQLNIESKDYDKDEFDNTFSIILIAIYSIFCFVPTFS